MALNGVDLNLQLNITSCVVHFPESAAEVSGEFRVSILRVTHSGSESCKICGYIEHNHQEWSGRVFCARSNCSLELALAFFANAGGRAIIRFGQFGRFGMARFDCRARPALDPSDTILFDADDMRVVARFCPLAWWRGPRLSA